MYDSFLKMDIYDWLPEMDPHVSAIKRFGDEGRSYSLRQNATDITYYSFTDLPRHVNGHYTTGYNFSYNPKTFDIEEDFDAHYFINWMNSYYWIGYLICMVYLGIIYFLGKYMKDKPRYELKGALIVWNVGLAVFSFCGAMRTLPENYHIISQFGFKFSVCYTGQIFLDNRVGGFWNWMFTLSKVPELGDTVFIVLRKQPLIFLHWYHHVTVLLYSWYSYSDYISTARWFVCMNYLVHSVMYGYYALKALRFRVPKYIAMFITTAQIAQMIMGTAVNIWAYQVKQAGNECHVSYGNIKISLIMYTSFFVLFAHFFRRAYGKKPIMDQKLKNGDAIVYDYEKSRKGKLE